MANISIPGYLDDALSYILEAADSTRGVDTTPIHMSVDEKDIPPEAEDSTKSVLFKTKIHVDKNKRSQVKDEIINYEYSFRNESGGMGARRRRDSIFFFDFLSRISADCGKKSAVWRCSAASLSSS